MRRTNSKMKSWWDFAFALLIAVTGAVLISAPVALVRQIYVLTLTDPTFEPLLNHWIRVSSLIVLFVVLIIAFIFIYVRRATTSIGFVEVGEPIGQNIRYSFIERLFLVPLLRSQVRVTAGATIALGLLVLIVGAPFLPPLVLGFLEFLIFLNFYREYATSYSGTKEALERLITQMIKTVASQAEFAIEEALGNKEFRLRGHLLLYDKQTSRLKLHYGYRMKGAPDEMLEISPDECVRGKAFSESIARAASPFKPDVLGYSKEHSAMLPADIEWMTAFPLIGAKGETIGVLGLDCNKHVDQAWLDKLLDFGNTSAQMIGLVNLLYRRDNIHT